MTSLREMWADGEATLGAWLQIPSSVSAEVMARAGFDYCCVDTQHGLSEYSDAVAMIQAVLLGGSRAIARVPWNEPGIIGKMLDAGAEGVIVPMVNTSADAEAAVAACRYAPDGGRSYGPSLAAIRTDRPYTEWAADHVACIVMIETAEAVANVDDILSVPGIDATYVGPSDLSISLGLAPGNRDEDPAFAAALDTILAACMRHGVVAGAHGAASHEITARRLEQGFRLISVCADQIELGSGAGSALGAAREAWSS